MQRVWMPRPPRLQAPGLHHVIGESVSSRALLYDNAARHLFFGRLAATTARYSHSIVGYCLLSTHYHLIVRTTEDDLSRGMQWMNSRFAEAINASEGERGHLFGARFWSKRIESDEQLIGVARYIALNPIKAGLCHLAEDWRWSSYSVLVRGLWRPPFFEPRPLITLLGPDEQRAIRRLRAIVEDADFSAV
jgi:putative transposase